MQFLQSAMKYGRTAAWVEEEEETKQRNSDKRQTLFTSALSPSWTNFRPTISWRWIWCDNGGQYPGHSVNKSTCATWVVSPPESYVFSTKKKSPNHNKYIKMHGPRRIIITIVISCQRPVGPSSALGSQHSLFRFFSSCASDAESDKLTSWKCHVKWTRQIFSFGVAAVAAVHTNECWFMTMAAHRWTQPTGPAPTLRFIVSDGKIR